MISSAAIATPVRIAAHLTLSFVDDDDDSDDDVVVVVVVVVVRTSEIARVDYKKW